MHMRATQHFHRGLLLSTPKEKKRISEKHTEIFLKFLFFCKQANKKEKNEENYLHGKAPNKQKKNEKYFWVFF